MTLVRARQLGVHELLASSATTSRSCPPIKAILDSPDLRLDGFLGPGHCRMVIGTRPYRFIPEVYGKPLVVAGFEPLDILHGRTWCCSRSAKAAARSRTSTAAWSARRATSRPSSAGEIIQLRPYFEWRGLGFITRAR